ncbi:MAG: neutral/alkaline non-lysosomal ceramidase N-terminal domain-containing protein [Candidatus Omnitrophica bacterium]|nr:neutral/alkaline non-lysosomal ceramidase N-terminal domain-containing protein [Candidatus Omnitrophota bacterium]
MNLPSKTMARRTFNRGLAAASALAFTPPSLGKTIAHVLQAGQGIVDITPPIGIELAGFHKTPGNERLIEGIRKPCAVRALVLSMGPEESAIVSVDIVGVSHDFSHKVSERVEAETGIPAGRVRICATHSHSTPTLRFCLQWGAIPEEYGNTVADSIVEAVSKAKADLSPAQLFIGKATAEGANFNRTTKDYQTEDHFDKESSDSTRWLDRDLHVLRFDRFEEKDPLLWYHFSAHPVCYTDTLAGPDWPALVTETIEAKLGITPSFLQGHAGDVNPGDGDPWLGVPEKVADRVVEAIIEANDNAVEVGVHDIPVFVEKVQIPLDPERLQQDLSAYREHPDQCSSGEWVDSGFAKAWFERASAWDPNRQNLEIQVSVMRLGEVALLFHPSELFSYYGLWIRERSPFKHTLLVGYTDGLIGYLTDPSSYEKHEYAAVVVPKILELPPYDEEATRSFSKDCLHLLEKIHS